MDKNIYGIFVVRTREQVRLIKALFGDLFFRRKSATRQNVTVYSSSIRANKCLVWGSEHACSTYIHE